MTELSACFACATGYHDECSHPHETEDGALECCCTIQLAETNTSGETESYGLVGRPQKSLNEIKDKTSAGRKRAATVAPIFPGMLCEWAGLRNAGGGVQPIVGCRGNRLVEKGVEDVEFMQGDRHHGPNKSTLDNTPMVNLHRICAECHHRWHSLNDEAYGKVRPPADEPWWPMEGGYLHDPVTEATEEELAASEAYWTLRPTERNAYPISLDTELRKIRR